MAAVTVEIEIRGVATTAWEEGTEVGTQPLPMQLCYYLCSLVQPCPLTPSHLPWLLLHVRLLEPTSRLLEHQHHPGTSKASLVILGCGLPK